MCCHQCLPQSQHSDANTRALPTIDLHVHSAHSDRPYSWFLRSGKAAECYTAVDEAYAIAKRRGMDLVTLADHDTIDGALELCSRHPGDTLVSVEVSARFPEDGCIVHVIAVAITEDHHRELLYTPYTALYNMSGQPAASLPLHWTPEGLPVGVQLVGRPADELTLLRLSAQLELARPWRDRHPGVWTDA